MPAAGYSQILNAVLRDNDLKPGPRLLYAVLASYAWRSPSVRLSTARLAADLHVSQRTVRRYLRVLEGSGWLRVRLVTGEVSEYTLLRAYHPGQEGQPTRVAPPVRTPGQVGRQPRTIPQGLHPGRDQRGATGILNGSTHPLLARLG